MTATTLDIAHVQAVCAGEPRVLVCTLFGSAQRGQQRAHSDVDLAIVTRAPLPAAVKCALYDALSAGCAAELDVAWIHHDSAPTVAREAVVLGTKVYEAHADAFADAVSLHGRRYMDCEIFFRRRTARLRNQIMELNADVTRGA